MSKRKSFNRDDIDAIAFLQIKRGDGTPIVSREEAKSLSSREICDLFRSRTQIAHRAPSAITGNHHPTNLEFMATAQHRRETVEIDVPEIAKTKRIAKKHNEFKARLLSKTVVDADVPRETTIKPTKRKTKIPSRPFPKAKRPMRRGKI